MLPTGRNPNCLETLIRGYGFCARDAVCGEHCFLVMVSMREIGALQQALGLKRLRVTVDG
jgi:hypothetical protein